MPLTPDVRRQLNRSAYSLISAISYLFHTLYYAAGAMGSWLDEHGAVFSARADVDDPDAVDELDDELEDE